MEDTVMWQFLHKPVDLRGWHVFFLIAIVLFMIAMFLPAVDGRPASRRAACSNNLRQLVIAMHLYHEDYGSLPPTYVSDKNGKPMHSWRTLILPYFEEDALYAAYNFDEPWNGTNNRKLAEYIPEVFRCPADKDGEYTNFLAVVGPHTMWRGSEPITFDAIPDEGSRTIAVVEVADSGIHWMEPRDLHVAQMAPGINPPAGQGISSNHRGGANVVFADGSVRFLRNDTPLEALEAMLRVDGGETFSWP